ncbi:hypothetical protein VNO77_15027 [Canavalia gladiata]|uniref:Uncharacterized protein n=1 Tax=Canavalia gladiata TaxID=3824 RepID=A0AAN9LZV8_CANGL
MHTKNPLGPCTSERAWNHQTPEWPLGNIATFGKSFLLHPGFPDPQISLAGAWRLLIEYNNQEYDRIELTTGDETEELDPKDISELKELVLQINEFLDEDNMVQQDLANSFEIDHCYRETSMLNAMRTQRRSFLQEKDPNFPILLVEGHITQNSTSEPSSIKMSIARPSSAILESFYLAIIITEEIL